MQELRSLAPVRDSTGASEEVGRGAWKPKRGTKGTRRAPRPTSQRSGASADKAVRGRGMEGFAAGTATRCVSLCLAARPCAQLASRPARATEQCRARCSSDVQRCGRTHPRKTSSIRREGSHVCPQARFRNGTGPTVLQPVLHHTLLSEGTHACVPSGHDERARTLIMATNQSG